MHYCHSGKRNILIWDGLDSGITDESYEVLCPNCQSMEHYSVKNIKDIDSIPGELSKYFIDEKIILKRDSCYEIKKSFPAYTIDIQCNGCGSNLWIIIGLKEIQPQRYNIYYKSVVYQDN